MASGSTRWRTRLSGRGRCRRVRSAAHALLVAFLATAVLPGIAAAQHLQFRQYAQNRGLSNLGVQCLRQDRAGFILICTEDGAFRFDGQHISPFGVDRGLPSFGLVYDTQQTADGRTFVAFSNAVYVAEPAAGDHLAPFVTARSADGPVDLTAPHRTAVLGNDLLLVERDRLSVVRENKDHEPSVEPFFDRATLSSHPELSSITAVAVAGNGIWLGCGHGQVCHLRWENGRCAFVSLLGAAQGLPAAQWAAFLFDRNGTLWIRSLDLFAQLPSGTSRFKIEPVPGGPGRYAGHADRLFLELDRSGHVVTQGADGLLIRDRNGWRVRSNGQGVPEGEIASLMFDREDSLWLGIRDQGLFRSVGGGRWENWTRNEGLGDNMVWQMSRIGSQPLWIASETGVDPLPATLAAGRDAVSLPGASWAVATTASGRVWRATVSGRLFRYDPALGSEREVASLPLVGEMMATASGLWIGTGDGLYRISDPDAADPTPPRHVPGTSGRIRDTVDDGRGGAWALTEALLLHVDAGNAVRPVFTRAQGLNASARTVAAAPDGTLWIGSLSSGIQRLRLQDGRVTHVEGISMPAIGSNTILMLRSDTRGWIWTGTDRGLDVWNGRVWHHLDEEDGLLSDDIDENSVFEDADGSMWFGTGHGVSHLLDPKPIFDVIPLHPIITGVTLGEQPLRSAVVDWSSDPLIVRFSALDFRDGSSIRFRYRLRGVDKEWVETASSEVRYPQLPPGRLLFSVQAINPLKHRTSVPVSFSVTVRPPWWRTWKFMAACVLAAGAACAAIVRFRVRYLVRRQRLLEALVTERTAEIEQARAALFEQATRDGLTGLLNRITIMQNFDLCMLDAERRGQPLAVALIDVDHFKSINDQLGHLGGDEVLRELGRRLSEALGPREKAGRYGGEELLVLLPDDPDASMRMHALRNAMVDRRFDIDGAEIPVTCSVGLGWWKSGDTKESVLRRADEALYAAKNRGRDLIVVAA